LIIKTFIDLCLDDRENLFGILNPVVFFILKNGVTDNLSKGDQKDHVKLFYIIFLFSLIVMSRGKCQGKENPEDSLLGVVRVSNRLFILVENSGLRLSVKPNMKNNSPLWEKKKML